MGTLLIVHSASATSSVGSSGRLHCSNHSSSTVSFYSLLSCLLDECAVVRTSNGNEYKPMTLYLLVCCFMCYFEDNAIYDINPLNPSTRNSIIILLNNNI